MVVDNTMKKLSDRQKCKLLCIQSIKKGLVRWDVFLGLFRVKYAVHVALTARVWLDVQQSPFM